MQKLALFFCTFTTLCALTWAQAYPGAQTQQQPSSQTPPAGQMTPGQGMVTADPSAQLHRDMRKLWTDHVVYTRDFIIAATENPSDVSAVTNRLKTPLTAHADCDCVLRREVAARITSPAALKANRPQHGASNFYKFP